MRVYELARELGVDSKEVMAQAEELSIDVKTASSGLSPEDEELLRMAFSGDGAAATEEAEEAAPEAEAVPEPEPAATGPDTVEEVEEPSPSRSPSAADDIKIATLTAGATVAEFAEAVASLSAR